MTQNPTHGWTVPFTGASGWLLKVWRSESGRLSRSPLFALCASVLRGREKAGWGQREGPLAVSGR